MARVSSFHGTRRLPALHVLGFPHLHGADRSFRGLPLGKPLGVLCYLAVEARVVRRDELCSLLWNQSAPDRARHSLRQALSIVRQVAGHGFVIDDHGGLALAPEVAVDLYELESSLSGGDLQRAWVLWSVGLLHDVSIPDAPAFDDWVTEVRGRWGERLADAWLGHALAQQLPTARLRWLERARTVAPWREDLHHGVIECCLDLRDPIAATEALGRAREALGADTDGLASELVARLEQLRQSEASAGLPSPDDSTSVFVGRTEQFATAAAAWRKARAGVPQILTLFGEIGAGKTRFAHELLRLAETEGAQIVQARGLGPSVHVPFSVINTLVRELLRLPGAAGISAGSSQTLHYLVPSHANQPEPRSMAPTLVALADAFDDLVHAVASERPLVVFIDNGGQIDEPTRQILTHLSQHLREGSMFLGMYAQDTDDELLAQVRALGAQPRITALHLEPFTANETEVLVKAFRPDHDDAELQQHSTRVHNRTGGVPGRIIAALGHRDDDAETPTTAARHEFAVEAAEAATGRRPARSWVPDLTSLHAGFGIAVALGGLAFLGLYDPEPRDPYLVITPDRIYVVNRFDRNGQLTEPIDSIILPPGFEVLTKPCPTSTGGWFVGGRMVSPGDSIPRMAVLMHDMLQLLAPEADERVFEPLRELRGDCNIIRSSNFGSPD